MLKKTHGQHAGHSTQYSNFDDIKAYEYRLWKDMDLFVRADPANAKATYAVLTEFGAPLQRPKFG